MKQGMELFARLVRMFLGHSAIADRKLDYGLNITILGIDVSLHLLVLLYSGSYWQILLGWHCSFWRALHLEPGKSSEIVRAD